WYWWRFNGHGYFWGMVAGLIPALVFPYLFPDTLDLYYFPLILLISLAGSLIGTYLFKPTGEATLKRFYRDVRPWGFWKPVLKQVQRETPGFKRNTAFKRDMFNIVVGIIWQTALVALPIYIVLLKWDGVIIAASIVLVASAVLKYTWWDKLLTEEFERDEVEQVYEKA